MSFFKDFYDAWHNNWTMAEQREHNRQIERGKLYLKQREVEAEEKIAANIRASKDEP